MPCYGILPGLGLKQGQEWLLSQRNGRAVNNPEFFDMNDIEKLFEHAVLTRFRPSSSCKPSKVFSAFAPRRHMAGPRLQKRHMGSAEPF